MDARSWRFTERTWRTDNKAMMLPVVRSNSSGASESPEADWQWQIRHAIRSWDTLACTLPLSPDEIAARAASESTPMPLSITPYYASLIDKSDRHCPIRMQCVPTRQESERVPGDLVDPLGEVEHEVAPHLVQRYPDRVLLLATDHCSVYCRFCTRSRMVGDGEGAVPESALDPAFRYIESNQNVRDVIVSGGDPLTLGTARLVRLVERIRAIPHVDTIRLATRVPVTLPMRITEELVSALRPHHPLWIMTHFNHPKEITPESIRACTRLVDAGFPVMNQSVLLRGINDDVNVLEALFRGLIRMRVKPYYLLQADPVQGTGHLRTPLSKGLELMQALQGRVTSIALPKFVCDTPGGKGKVPLSLDAIVSSREGETVLRTFRGEQVTYLDPPA